MKKYVSCLIGIWMVFFFVGGAWATTKLLPKGTVVSATINVKKEVAHISIKGVVPVEIKVYKYAGPTNILGRTNSFNIDLNSGRRFNFKFKATNGREYFVLLTPEMANFPPSFFGKDIGLDCSNADGCVFLITGK